VESRRKELNLLNSCLCKKKIKKLVGKSVVAIKKDGTKVTGKLVKIKGSQVYIKPKNSKKVSTKALLPLVLFDLLAIGRPGAYGYPAGPGAIAPYGARPYPYGGAGVLPYGIRNPYGDVGASPYGFGYPDGFL
jgi:nitrate reductase NapE component